MNIDDKWFQVQKGLRISFLTTKHTKKKVGSALEKNIYILYHHSLSM